MKSAVAFIVALGAAPVLGHTGAFARGMYCRNGASNVDSPNTNTVVNPLYGLAKKDWWMQADRGCPNYPPPEGEFLELPVGKTFTVELAFNRAFTTLSYGGKSTSDWPDGAQHPDDWNGFTEDPGEGCIQGAGGALHVQNQGNATGTAFAISYNSDLSKVTMENLVVFTVAEHTPWKRVTTYQVPADLPPCPPGGCHCAYGWAPNGCGQRNVYLQPFKCNVIGSTSTQQVAEAKPPVYCKDDKSKCTAGAKQVIIFAQLEGNNVTPLPGKSPGYNAAWGFPPGAQNDIYTDAVTSPAAGNSSSAISAYSHLPSATGLPSYRSSAVLASASANKTYSSVHVVASSIPSNRTNSTSVIRSAVVSATLSAPMSASSTYDECSSDDDSDESSQVYPTNSAAVYSSAAVYASVVASARNTQATVASRRRHRRPSGVRQAPGKAAAPSAIAAPSAVVAPSAVPVPSADEPASQPKSSQRATTPFDGLEAELQNFVNFIDAAWGRWQQGHA